MVLFFPSLICPWARRQIYFGLPRAAGGSTTGGAGRPGTNIPLAPPGTSGFAGFQAAAPGPRALGVAGVNFPPQALAYAGVRAGVWSRRLPWVPAWCRRDEKGNLTGLSLETCSLRQPGWSRLGSSSSLPAKVMGIGWLGGQKTQGLRFRLSPWVNLVAGVGFEPTTFGL